MEIVLDFPLVRKRLKNCPLCDTEKPPETLVCWACYRKFDLRNGTPESVRAIIAKAEEECYQRQQ